MVEILSMIILARNLIAHFRILDFGHYIRSLFTRGFTESLLVRESNGEEG